LTTLVVGASGATGRLLVAQLLDRGEAVKAIVRSAQSMSEEIARHDNLTLIVASISKLSDTELQKHVAGCDALASCLGHNMTFKGVFGPPRRLVRDAVRRLCDAVKATQSTAPVKIVVMNTAGNRNRDLNEPVSFAQASVLWLVRSHVPPHADNEEAAEYLRTRIGQNDLAIKWCVVRPDTLGDTGEATPYDLHPSPTRSAIFNPGKTSRANVAHFMADLVTDVAVWAQWKGQMPVIYDRS
jgi:putative NADH-flavin reductase